MRQYFIPRSPKDKGFTLVEVLLTVAILAVIMAPMVPFVRTVYNSWNLGDRKTEIQQNGRVGLAAMSGYLRQAKRITAIPPSGSGNFVKFRDSSDTQTIIFFHNVASSAYYIGNTGLIKNNDLVMRTIDINNNTANALLASSLNSFNINFKDSLGQIVTTPYNVYFIEINISLSDSQGLIPDIMSVFSTISVRPAVRINKPVWLAYSSNIAELFQDIVISGFSSASSVSVNPTDGSCWVADTNNNSIKKLSSTGTILLNISGFNSPKSVSVNSTDGSCWVADTNNSRIKKLSSTGSILVDVTASTKNPQSVSVNPSSGECWVADTNNGKVKKLSSTGVTLVDSSGGSPPFKNPQSVSVNFSSGECWVADSVRAYIRKFSSSGAVLVDKKNFSQPICVSVNSSSGECWVVDANNIKKLDSGGNVLFTLGGFNSPKSVSVNSTDGSCWVADTGSSQVVKLDKDGNEEFRISGFPSPLSVASAP